MNLGIILENYQDDVQDLINRIKVRNNLIEGQSKTLRKRRDLLLSLISNLSRDKSSLIETSPTISLANSLYNSRHSESNDQLQKYVDEIFQKDIEIGELKEQVEHLTKQVNTLKLCNDEMQNKLALQNNNFQRNNLTSQSMIVPKFTTSSERAMATIDKFVSPITISSLKSNDSKQLTSEEKRNYIKRLTMSAAASAHMMAAKGDYTTLQQAMDEISSNRSQGSQKSLK